MTRAARWGITLPFDGVPLAEQADWVHRCEDLGYTDLWTSEVGGLDAFAALAAAAPCSRRARLGTAIAGVFQRGPALLAMQAAALAEAAPGRFVLGIGSSSPLIVEGWNAARFERPFTRVRDTLRFLRRALAGERVDETFDSFRVRGFRLERPPAEPPPIYLAALRQRMLRLAGAEADGVLLGLVTPQDVSRLLDVARAARPPDAGELDVALRIGVLPIDDADRADRVIRRILAVYLNSPPYRRMHEWLGRGTELAALRAAWEAQDAEAARAAVPQSLVDGIFVHGAPARCRERIEAFVAAGVTTPIVQLTVPGDDLAASLKGLAPSA